MYNLEPITTCAKCGRRDQQERMTVIADNKAGENARWICTGGCNTVDFDDGTSATLDRGIIQGEFDADLETMLTADLKARGLEFTRGDNYGDQIAVMDDEGYTRTNFWSSKWDAYQEWSDLNSDCENPHTRGEAVAPNYARCGACSHIFRVEPYAQPGQLPSWKEIAVAAFVVVCLFALAIGAGR